MSLHINTPRVSVFDPRGLLVRTVDYCRAIEDGPVAPRINRILHDPAGHAVKQWDPRLWLSQVGDPLTPANLIRVFTLGASVIRSDSVDTGTQIELKGLATQTVFSWDSRQTRRDIEYDALLRPVAIFEQGASEARRCGERLTYGHPGSGDLAQNHYGQLIRHDHPAGSVLFNRFAISGECTEDTRHFTQDPLAPDWPKSEADRQRLLEPGAGATSRWRHGALGDVLEQTDARENRHTFALTVDGHLRERRLQLKGEPEQTLVRDIHYNAQGNVTQETAGNGVQTTRTYSPEDNRLLVQRTEDADGLVLQHLSYGYDRVGNVLSIEDKSLPIRYFANQRIDPVSRFVYDSLYQLTKASGWEAGAVNRGPQSMGRIDPGAVSNYQQTYEYDPGGNLCNLIHVGAQSHGRKLQPARYSNRSLPYVDVIPGEAEIEAAYDRRGNLLTLESGRVLNWNLRNQLQTVCPVERASGINDHEVYLYDGGSQRVRKVRSLRTGVRSLIADVRYLPGLELRTDNGTGERLQIIVTDNARVQHWESPPPSGVNNRWRYQHIDHLGSVSLETAGDGTLIGREKYHPFGTSAWQNGELSYKFVRYSGKERDATGLDYYGHRYYISWLQKWSSPDPAGEVDGLNLYRMVRNNPGTLIDADGRRPQLPEQSVPPGPPALPPPPPPVSGIPPPLPGAASRPLTTKKWVIKEDPALYKQQGGEYPYYSSFTIALQKLDIEHYSSIDDIKQFVDVWREVGRNMTPPARNIDNDKALEVQGVLGKIDEEWPSYHRADVKELFRGDTTAILNSYPWLAEFVESVGDDATESILNVNIRSQLIMSTSKDPGMGYVSGKSIMWHFEVEPGHAGVSEGLYASEGEVTFPMYNKVKVVSVQHIPKGRSYMDNTARFGTAHRYVIKARMLPR